MVITSHILSSGKLSRTQVSSIYHFAMNLRHKTGAGQRTIAREIKRRFHIVISEHTVSGWIYLHNVPFAQEKTQFKPKPHPPRKKLYFLYISQQMSASDIARRYHVSTSIVINWLRFYHISLRSHQVSMNTNTVKKKLRDLHLSRPTKKYSLLTSEKAYVFGVLAGDGHINSKFIRFEIRHDREFIEEFLRCMQSVYGICYFYHYYAPRNSYVAYIPSQIICQDLLHYGDFRTFTWRIPKVITSTQNKKIIGYYLRGLYDSEGSVGRYEITFTSVSRNGIYGVKKLLKRLGIPSKIRTWTRQKKVYYTLRIGKKMYRKKFRDMVGFTIVRKQERLPL